MVSTQALSEQSTDLHLESDLLSRFVVEAQMSGLVGEEKNAMVVLLAGASAKLQKPLNVSIGGASSAGKNHLINTVARFIPEPDKKIITGMTPKALMHAEEDEYEHKAVFVAEYEGVSGADYAIRTFQSEQAIEWEFVESTLGGLRKQKRRVRGPAAFIQATTRPTLHPENETRLLFVQIDESAAQTRAINERQALEAERKLAPCPVDLYEKWYEFFSGLEPKPVRIPYATQLANSLPPDRIRSRRDFPKLLSLIEVSAYLHQYRRGKDPDGTIVAGAQDYLLARELFEHCYYTGPDSKVGELLDAAERLKKDEFSVSDLMTKLRWCKSKTYQVLARAEDLVCIAEGDRRGRYKLLCTKVEAPLKLPPKIKMTADDFRISMEGQRQ